MSSTFSNRNNRISDSLLTPSILVLAYRLYIKKCNIEDVVEETEKRRIISQLLDSINKNKSILRRQVNHKVGMNGEGLTRLQGPSAFDRALMMASYLSTKLLTI